MDNMTTYAEELAKDIQDARREFGEGRCREATPSELTKEISL